MNEQDKEAFEKWYDSSLGTHIETWQAAIEYARNDSSIKVAQAQALAIQERDKNKELEEKLAVAERAAMQNGCDRNKAEFNLAAVDAKIDELKQQVIDYETDWRKMRKYYDGAMEKMAIAIEALEYIEHNLESPKKIEIKIAEALEKIKR